MGTLTYLCGCICLYTLSMCVVDICVCMCVVIDCESSPMTNVNMVKICFFD